MLDPTGYSASARIEQISSKASSVIFLYDLAECYGFGNITREYLKQNSNVSKLVSLQSRSGSGMSIIGRLSQGTSKEGGNPSTLTAYITPVGLVQMAGALSLLPAPKTSSRLVIQVPNVSTTGPNLALSPSLSSLSDVLFNLPDSVYILLSATPQESIDMASIAYQLPYHTVHIFDQHSSARESSNLIESTRTVSARGTPKDLLNQLGYDFFEFVGDAKAHTVLVVLNTPLALAVKTLIKTIPGLAAIIVRVVRPWDKKAFTDVLPSTARNVYVLEEVPFESAHSGLFVDVFAALFDPTGFSPAIHGFPCTPEKMNQYIGEPESLLSSITGINPNFNHLDASSVLPTTGLKAKKLLFFSSSDSTGAALPKVVVERFISQPKLLVRHLSAHDTFLKLGGITTDRVILSEKTTKQDHIPMSTLIPLSNTTNTTNKTNGSADFVGITDSGLLKTHSILTCARHGAAVLVHSAWTPKEFLANVPADTLTLIQDRKLRIYLLDPKTLARDLLPYASSSSQDKLETVYGLLGFVQLYVGKGGIEGQHLVQQVARYFVGDSVEGVPFSEIYDNFRNALVLVPIQRSDVDVDAKQVVLKHLEFNSIVPVDRNHLDVATSEVGTWHDAAKHIIFREAFAPTTNVHTEEYSQVQDLRPDIPDRTYLVTTTVNRRLTPKEYDRNVFHMEFDTSGTGLKYAIGEALGIHGWNDSDEVHDFCRWYGVDPDQLVTIPALGRGNGQTKLVHTRTVFQILQQQIDIFGKPPKSFYGLLSKYATRREERMALYFISSPEGSSTFKKLSEKDTVTYVDVLKMYPSAKPPIAELCELVGDIAPRHYSIASSQAAVGDRVDLLVVTVDWTTPSGARRYGQCTRYLAGLKQGQKVTVSIKPSVMKLPSDPMQPIVMAGLGTGAAPFRAFMQHRAWLKAQGVKVGPLLYYFGSRHRSQEYLYGEEIEAYINENVITHCGLAFSRDGKKKLYIQHKMKDDAEMLANYLNFERGVFYLCGPTWPVPDVYETLVGALEKYTGKSIEEAGVYLEGLKEEERYVLEVY